MIGKSAWLQRGFLESIRLQIANEIVLSNAPRTMLEAVLESRRAICGETHNDTGIAANLILEWIRAARDTQEGRAIPRTKKNKILVFPKQS